jgi:hypothetical protein
VPGALAACGPAPTVVRLTIDVDPALAVDGLTLDRRRRPQDLRSRPSCGSAC